MILPLPLVLALILALGFRPSPFSDEPASGRGLIEIAAVVGLMGLAAAAVGSLLARRMRRSESSFVRLRSRYLRTASLLNVLNLLCFGWVLHGLGWMSLVDTRLGLSRAVLLDEALLLAPFLIGQLAIWASLVPAERVLRGLLGEMGRNGSVWSHVLLKARSSYGLVLPGVALYTAGSDLFARLAPATSELAIAPLISMVMLGAILLVLAPLLVRLAFPTRPLPGGPLRQRLEQLARRLGFRYTDILLWDTGGLVANAGITGALPFFRYVLLSDALIARLDADQVEAVFGHEVGHIAHRHLSFFGLFFVGSVGVLAMVGAGFDWLLDRLPLGLDRLPASSNWPMIVESIGVVACLVILALFVYLVFGFLSRKFERQADVYGCRAVSCGQAICPPHEHASASGRVATTLCPSAIRTFAQSLADVAMVNGIELEARSWRHGSIARRIKFLLDLEGHPEVESRFQQRVKLLRLGLATSLVAVVIAALATGALDNL